MSQYPAVMPHHGLKPICEDAWYLQGSVDFKPLVRLVRNMVVLRHEGALTLINSVRLNAKGEAALDVLGKVTHVVKIGIHGMDDAYYADRYGATLWDVPGADHGDRPQPRVMSAEDLPHPGLSLFLFKDTKRPEAALVLNAGGGVLITCDSIQHWEPSDLMSLPAKLITKVMGFKHPANIGPPWCKLMTPEGGSLRPDFERLAALPFQQIIGGHGGLCKTNGPALLRATITRVYGA